MKHFIAVAHGPSFSWTCSPASSVLSCTCSDTFRPSSPRCTPAAGPLHLLFSLLFFSCRAVQRCTPGQGCLGHPACQRPALLLCFPSVMLSLLNALHFVYPSCSVLVSPDVSSVNTGTLSVHGCALSTNDASHGVSPVSAGWADYRALRRGLKSYRVLDQTTCPHFHVSHLVLKHLL